MKIFQKIKHENGRRYIFFCGIKIISYKKDIFALKNRISIDYDAIIDVLKYELEMK